MSVGNGAQEGDGIAAADSGGKSNDTFLCDSRHMW